MLFSDRLIQIKIKLRKANAMRTKRLLQYLTITFVFFGILAVYILSQSKNIPLISKSLQLQNPELQPYSSFRDAGLQQEANGRQMSYDQIPVDEFCETDDKKKRFSYNQYQNIMVSTLPDSVVNSVQKFIFFVGYPRSGHSIVGSLLDSHPHMVISNEFCLFHKLLEEPQHQWRDILYNAIFRNSVCSYYFGLRNQEASRKGYTLRVDNSWQARYNQTIAVIGDKSGGTTISMYRHQEDVVSDLYKQLLAEVQVPVFAIHAVRNPYDNIATMALMSKESEVSKLQLSPEHPFENQKLLDSKISDYFRKVNTVDDIIGHLNLSVIEVHSIDLISDPKKTFAKICDTLEIYCDEEYLRTVDNKVFSEPSRTRELVVWTPDQVNRVAEELHKYQFLQRYNFDN